MRCFIKSINSETNNKSAGNNDLTTEFNKYFSNELTPVLLDVYDSWRKLGTLCVTFRNYKKGDKKYFITIDPFQLRL